LSEYKLFLQRIGLMGITQILVMLSTIILLPILTKNYSVSDYGIWVQVYVTLNLIPAIITLGLSFSMIRFLVSKKDKEEIQEGFYSITFMVLITGIITSILFFLFSGTIAEVLFNNNIMAAQILSLIIFLTALNSIYYNYFRTFQMMKIYSIFLVLQAYLTVLFVYYFAISGYSIAIAVMGILITQSITFCIALILIIRFIGFKIPKMKNIKVYLSLGLPTVFSTLSYWIVESSDRYIIGILLGTIFVGYYSPSYTLGNLILMLIFPFSVLLLPLLSKNYDENDMDNVRLFMKYSLKFFLGIAIPTAIGLSLLSKPIIQILSTPEIAANGYLVTPFVAISAILYGIYSIIINIIILKKKTMIIGFIWLFAAILNIIMNLALIPYYGILGSAIATLASYILSFILAIFYSSKHFKIDFDLLFIGKTMAASMIMSLIIIIFYPIGIINLLIVIGVCALVYIGVLILLKGFKKEEINFIKTLLK